MDKEKNILNAMVAQHALIEALFFIFKDETKSGSEKAKPFFLEFLWEIKKHFFIEEGAIFDFLPWKDPQISEMIDRVKNEHINILNNLEKIKNNLQTEPFIDNMENFYRQLTLHREFEEQKLYPVLDKRLIKIQKEQIISHINQILLKNGNMQR